MVKSVLYIFYLFIYLGTRGNYQSLRKRASPNIHKLPSWAPNYQKSITKWTPERRTRLLCMKPQWVILSSLRILLNVNWGCHRGQRDSPGKFPMLTVTKQRSNLGGQAKDSEGEGQNSLWKRAINLSNQMAVMRGSHPQKGPEESRRHKIRSWTVVIMQILEVCSKLFFPRYYQNVVKMTVIITVLLLYLFSSRQWNQNFWTTSEGKG